MNIQDWIVRALPLHMRCHTIELHGYKVNSTEVLAPAQVIEVPLNEASRPFLRLANHQAQVLIDSLWECGVRPTEGTAGAMAATQHHLKDMQELVFKERHHA